MFSQTCTLTAHACGGKAPADTADAADTAVAFLRGRRVLAVLVGPHVHSISSLKQVLEQSVTILILPRREQGRGTERPVEGRRGERPRSGPAPDPCGSKAGFHAPGHLGVTPQPRLQCQSAASVGLSFTT